MSSSSPRALEPLESVIATEELFRRPSRKPDPEAVIQALVLLSQEMANSAQEHSPKAGGDRPYAL